jgi:O-antigen ligase
MITASLIALLLVGTYVVTQLLEHSPTPWLEHMTRTVLVVLVMAILYFLIEELTAHAIKKAVFWLFRAVRFGPDGIWLDRNAVVEIHDSSIKWRMPPVGFLLWPTLLICSLQLGHVGKRALIARCGQIGILGLSAWTIWLSTHRTSVAALIAAVIIFGLATWRPDHVRRLLGVGWIAAFVIIVPLVLTIFSFNFHNYRLVSASLDARFILWAYTAEHVKDHPVRGIGAGATPVIDAQALPIAKANTTSDYVYLWRPGPHAHNIFLQSWFELGALGTLILAAFGLCILSLTALAPLATQPYLLAAFATVAVTSSASFGLFELWYMAAFAMCAITCVMAVSYHRRLHLGRI